LSLDGRKQTIAQVPRAVNGHRDAARVAVLDQDVVAAFDPRYPKAGGLQALD